MLKRISTLARDMLRRPSYSLLSAQSNQSRSLEPSPVTPLTSMSPNTVLPLSTLSTEFSFASGLKGYHFKLPGPSIDLSSLSDDQIETVADPTPTSFTSDGTTAPKDEVVVEGTSVAVDTPENGHMSPDHHPNRVSVSQSDVSSVGSLTLASSSESLKSKTSTAATPGAITTTVTKTTTTTTTVATTGRPVSTATLRQRYLEECQSRKVTIPPRTRGLLAERAESLRLQLQLQQQQQQRTQSTVRHKDYTQYMAHQEHQDKLQKSPTFVPRPSIDRLRSITKKDPGTRPPVQSLIEFWKQVEEPVETLLL